MIEFILGIIAGLCAGSMITALSILCSITACEKRKKSEFHEVDGVNNTKEMLQ